VSVPVSVNTRFHGPQRPGYGKGGWLSKQNPQSGGTCYTRSSRSDEAMGKDGGIRPQRCKHHGPKNGLGIIRKKRRPFWAEIEITERPDGMASGPSGSHKEKSLEKKQKRQLQCVPRPSQEGISLL